MPLKLDFHSPETTKQKTLWQELNDSHNGDNEFTREYNSLNKKLGNALGQLPEQPQDIQGRKQEIEMLHAILERPKTPVALLLGEAGVGKTALVEQFAKDLNNRNLETQVSQKYLLVSLRLGTLASIGTTQLQTQLSTLLDDVKVLEDAAQRTLNDPSIRIVLFMDEVHMLVTIFGPGTKVGGDVIKDVLARSPIRVIAATTRREYDTTLAVDAPLRQRFKQIEMQELPPDVVVHIGKNWWEKVAPDVPQPEEQVLRKIIEANALYRSDSAEPRKSLDILEDLVSYSRRTGQQADGNVVNDIFKRRYGISLTFKVQADSIYNEVASRVKGQEHALSVLKRLFRSMAFQLDPTSNRPIATALFTGPTGVGKTETVKAMAKAMYPGENVIQFINMPDYKSVEHEPAFRKKIGEVVSHVPNSIILLDELDKCSPEIRDSLLAILDEGIVTYETTTREGLPQVDSTSLRNTIVIATTNAGADVFANDARFSQRESMGKNVDTRVNDAAVDRLINTLRENLEKAGKFRAELLGRFQRIVPYRFLASDTILAIAEGKLEELFAKFDKRGIELIHEEKKQWPKNLYDYETWDIPLYISFVRTKATDSNAGGARAVNREIDTMVKDMIVDAIYNNPHTTKFKIEVSKESRIYDVSADPAAGGVVVHALN